MKKQKNKVSDVGKTPEARRLEMLKAVAPIGKGSLWWGREDLIHEKFARFDPESTRKGHPLVVVRDDGTEDFDCGFVPMLVGTSGKHLRKQIQAQCFASTGLTADDPEHVTYFGSILEPGLFYLEDLMDGLQSRKKEGPWHSVRRMIPNRDKPRLSPKEMAQMTAFCEKYHL